MFTSCFCISSKVSFVRLTRSSPDAGKQAKQNVNPVQNAFVTVCGENCYTFGALTILDEIAANGVADGRM